MNLSRYLRLSVAALIVGLLPMTIGTVVEALSGASIQGQDGWSGGTIPIDPSVDQALDQSGLHQRTGIGAWRVSNSTALGDHNGAFAGWVFSRGLGVAAGQPSSGAAADQFRATVWFHSVSPSADGSYIEIDLGNVAGTDRNTNLSLQNTADTDGGLRLRVNQWFGDDFNPAIIAKGITRNEWHRLEIVANFHDGPANDTVEYALDGVALVNPVDPAKGTKFGTYEGYFDSLSQPYSPSNRLFFRSNWKPSDVGATFVDTGAKGFYFDDVTYSVAQQSAPASVLDSYATGFEPGMSAGSSQGQEGWSGGTMPIDMSVDQLVEQSGSSHHTGTGALRISNDTSLGNHNGAFAGWVFGPGLAVAAGQPSSGAGADQFTATLWFRSASASADGSNMEIDLGSAAGDDRNTFLALTNKPDDTGGLQLRAGEPDGASGDFRDTVAIATGLARTEWHRLDIVARFNDGSANDTVEYRLDGEVLTNPNGGTTFGTFEGYFEGIRQPYVLSNRLFFRSGAAPTSYGGSTDSGALGFYFDDVSYSVAKRSTPGTLLASYSTGFESPAVPAPDLTVKSQLGGFVRGQSGAKFAVTVTNSGTPSTIGTVTLIDNLPPGLTVTAASGAGWTCGVIAATVTCSRNDALAPGASYPPVTIAVNVAGNAPGSVTNTATVSGGGESQTTNNTATDAATVLPQNGGSALDIAGFFANDPAFGGGVTVAAADVTGDGVPELITGAGPGGAPIVRVFKVAGGAVTEIASFDAYDPAFRGGVNVAAGDVNGDGVAEIITGAGPGGGPHVRVFSLANGVVKEVGGFFAYDPTFPGGVNVAAGDVNGDGVAEIITGAGPGGGPHVRAFRLAHGVVTEVAGFFAYDPAFPGGVNVAAGDVNGDGVAEIITGAGPGGGPHVRAFSVAGGAVTEVAGFFAYAPAFAGGVNVAAADLTGDGVAEVITGAGPGGGPHVRVINVSGMTIK